MFHISEVHAGYRNRAKWTLLLQNSSGSGFGNRTRRLRGGPALRTPGVDEDLWIIDGFLASFRRIRTLTWNFESRVCIPLSIWILVAGLCATSLTADFPQLQSECGRDIVFAQPG